MPVCVQRAANDTKEAYGDEKVERDIAIWRAREPVARGVSIERKSSGGKWSILRGMGANIFGAFGSEGESSGDNCEGSSSLTVGKSPESRIR